MDVRLARWLTSLYPAQWQKRYGREFIALLESQPQTFAAIVDVAWSAGRQQLRACGGCTMNARETALMSTAFVYLGAIAVGARVYGADSRPAFWIAATGALLATAVASAIVFPVMSSIVAAYTARPASVLNRIAVPLTTTVTLSVMMYVLFADKGAASTRLGMAISALLVSGVIGSAAAVVSVRRSA